MKKSILLLIFPVIMVLFITTVNAQCNFTNGGFEAWQIDPIATLSNDTVYYESPSSWYSLVDQFGAGFALNAASFIPKVNKTTDKYSGNFAVRLDANGNESSDLEAYDFCNSRPTSLKGFFKYNGSANDTFMVNVFMINENPTSFMFSGDTSTNIGFGSFIFLGNQITYQQFSININYKSSAPADTFVIIISNVNSDSLSSSTSVFLDDIAFYGGAITVDEFYNNLSPTIYPNPSTNNVTIDLSATENVKKITLLDIQGKIIYVNTKIESNLLNIDLTNQPQGIYLLKVDDSSSSKVYKIIKE